MNGATGNPLVVPTSWRLVGSALVTTVLLWPIAAHFYAPTAIGYVQLPGVIIFAAISVISFTCYVLCPRGPLLAKWTSLLITIHGAYWMIYSAAYYWLNLQHGG